MEAILQDTRDKMKIIEEKKKEVVLRVRKLIVADNLKPLSFKYKDEKGFVEYYKGVWVRDITSDLAHELGITNLHIIVKYDTNIPAHEHDKQSQTILIKFGKIFDLETKMLYTEGECFFITRQHNHKLKYFANSEYLITFQPNLIET